MSKRYVSESQIGRRTDTGKIRAANEDNLGDIPVEGGHLFVVSDGMGGYRGGAVASELTIEAIEEYFRDSDLSNPLEDLKNAINLANERIQLRGRQDEELSRMGSTCIVALVLGNKLYFAHVGDSRIYLLRKGKSLQTLTKDHTVVQFFVDSGLMTAEEAENHPESHILSRALGPHPKVEPEVHPEPIELNDGDKVLLCTDGLTKMVPDKKIEEILSSERTPQEIADTLVEMANREGGEDNITVIVFEHKEKKN